MSGRFSLSFRAGDRFLGARNGTVAALVERRRLRAVRWGRRLRVLREDLEALAREGLAPDLSRPPCSRRKPTTAGVGARILAIDLTPREVTPPPKHWSEVEHRRTRHPA